MTRLIHRPITVKLANEQPRSFTDEGNTRMISAIVDQWIEAGNWIQGEPQHHMYRVVTSEQFVYDIERVGEDWAIYRAWD